MDSKHFFKDIYFIFFTLTMSSESIRTPSIVIHTNKQINKYVSTQIHKYIGKLGLGVWSRIRELKSLNPSRRCSGD